MRPLRNTLYLGFEVIFDAFFEPLASTYTRQSIERAKGLKKAQKAPKDWVNGVLQLALMSVQKGVFRFRERSDRSTSRRYEKQMGRRGSGSHPCQLPELQ